MPSESDGADVQQRSLVVTGQWLSNFNYCTQKGNIEQLSPEEEQLKYGGKGGTAVTVKLFYEPKKKHLSSWEMRYPRWK